MNIRTDLTSSLLTAMLAMTAPALFAADGIEIDHLGTNNTLVRITGDSRYVLLPVEEAIDDARINILVDGKIAETIFVRLAKSKCDYSVPFDLAPYKGHNVILDVVTPHGRSTTREASEDACWQDIALADSFDTSDRETKYRPRFHHTPQYGWMNDPNGMFYKDGVWHLYYQYNPYGSKWQNMTWGHSSSTDLVNWKHEPVALRPDGLGAIFSGSSVVDHDNTAGYGKDAVIALYTSAGTSQMQSLAASTDGGMTFVKNPANPIITLDSEARDPNMFWNEQTGEWNLVLAHALDHEMLFFTSPDLKHWTLSSAFGKGMGAQDGVWECPDLFPLPVDGTDKQKWVLVCNLNPGGPFGGSGVQYFVGDWDGHTFTADTDAAGTVPTKWLDYGKDNYALVSFSGAPDSRRTVLGWMSNWQYAADVPTTQYRSANTLPRDLSLFTADNGQIYLASTPSPELAALRDKTVAYSSSAKVGKKGKSFRLPADGVCEITADIASAKAPVVFTIANKSGDKVDITYNPADHTIAMDRRQSGKVDFSENFPAVTVAPTFENSGAASLRIFLDRSSVEIFANDGRASMTNLVFPTEPYSTLSIATDKGSAKINNLKIYSLK